MEADNACFMSSEWHRCSCIVIHKYRFCISYVYITAALLNAGKEGIIAH